MSEFGNRGFKPETQTEQGGEQVKLIKDLHYSPWDDLTQEQDLEILSILTSDPEKDESEIQMIVSNTDAVNAVRMGWLEIEKDENGEYTAFTTPAWEEERKRINTPLPRPEKPKSKIKPKPEKKANTGVIKFDAADRHEKNGNGNGKNEKSLLNLLSHIEALHGRFLIDSKNHKVIIFTDVRHVGIEKEFTGPDKDVLMEVAKYVYSTYQKPKHD